MDKSNSHMALIAEIIGTKNPNYFIALFQDTKKMIDEEMHVIKFNTRLLTKSEQEEYQELMDNGTNVRMNTTPKD